MSNVTRFPMAADTWRDDLILNNYGRPKPLLANAITAFRQHPQFRGRLSFDGLRVETMVNAPLPWEDPEGWEPRGWTDTDDSLAANWLHHLGIEVKTNIVAEAVQVVAHDRAFHPVRDYLDSLVWDGTPRVAKWLSYYLGVEHTPYSSAVGKAWLIAAVARIMKPGCKADNMLIFEGKQDLGKSAVAKTLGGAWFTDELAEIGSTNACMQMQGVWIIEIAELDALSKSDALKTKAFITRTTDRFRPAYGRRVVERARQCVFIGTTNQESYLKDPTGGRRFWPVRVTSIDLPALREDRDQLWAEATHLFHAGESWWLSDREIIAAATQEQTHRYEDDPWQNLIGNFLHTKFETSTDEILTEVLDIPKGKWSRADQMRVAACIQVYAEREGDPPWEKRRSSSGHRGYRYYRQRSAS